MSLYALLILVFCAWFHRLGRAPMIPLDGAAFSGRDAVPSSGAGPVDGAHLSPPTGSPSPRAVGANSTPAPLNSYWRNRSAWLEDNTQHSVKVDRKPARRVRDVEALRRFHDHTQVCLCCYASGNIHAHHLLFRSRGGDDVPENLIPLCDECHGAVHGQSYVLEGVRITQADVEATIAEFLRDERGEDHCAYLIRKLGAFGAEHFVQKLEGTATR